jgi:hypothetical protein
MNFVQNFKRWLSPTASRKNMWFDVHKFINVEMIRDGGSFACKFEGRDGNQYILFTKIRFASVGASKKEHRDYSQKKEIVGYEKPVIIDCDPAKRPTDTKTRIYSELCGPAGRVSWRQAGQIIGKAGALAQGLNPIQADWFKRMTAIVEGDGHAPAAWPACSTWHRPS